MIFFSSNEYDPTCASYDCAEKYVHTYTCVEYTKEPNDLNCAIPCLLRNCTKKLIKKWSMCLTWDCQTPDTPIIPPSHPMAIGAIVGSIIGTIIGTLIVAGLMILVKNIYKRRHHHHLPDDQNDEEGNHPSIISKCC